MREKKFRFLEQLEDDLRDAAARERVADETKPRRTSRSSSHGGGHNRTRWLAAAVVALVVAGGIGAFVQNRDHSYRPTSALSSPVSHNSNGGNGATPGSANWEAVGGAIKAQFNQLGDSTQRLSSTSVNAAASAAPAPAGGLYSFDQVNSPNIAAASTPVRNTDLSKVVKNGVITVELPDGKFPTTKKAVVAMAGAAGGHVLSSTARGSGSGTFVLRIPAAAFDQVMSDLSSLPEGTVLWQHTTSQDVTAQFIDSNAQLQILRAQKDATLRYLKNAGSLSQSIQFRNQAFQIQGEIDKLTGQLKFLKDQVALATITVNLRETGAPATHKPAPVTKPSLVRAWDRAVSGFLGVLSAVIVGLGFLIPLGIIAIVIGFPVMVLVRRRRAASSAS